MASGANAITVAAVDEDFWLAAATIMTAVATIALVVVTSRMARRTADATEATEQSADATRATADATREAARATQAQAQAAREEVEASRAAAEASQTAAERAREQALLARQALELSVAPLLVDLPSSLGEGGGPTRRYIFPDGHELFIEAAKVVCQMNPQTDSLYISVPFRNIGQGVALLTGLGLRPIMSYLHAFTPGVVAPGETTRALFAIPPPSEGDEEYIRLRDQVAGGSFTVEIGYTDGLGGQYKRTQAQCTLARPSMEVKVRQLMFHRSTNPESEPYAASGPADA